MRNISKKIVTVKNAQTKRTVRVENQLVIGNLTKILLPNQYKEDSNKELEYISERLSSFNEDPITVEEWERYLSTEWSTLTVEEDTPQEIHPLTARANWANANNIPLESLPPVTDPD